ncbi:IclR family transcriptional regulator [Lentzea flaviverrucosa]|uniref:Transcriptional regulator, IclR family n=1 Tax=Lentzea flaviverrucosa TaxID=200379 RepID=A0A1H9BIU6_9PSEU|nr:IclR family transcriptional regulator [Lentzea flaviverrucosa]SEP88647.1 transcriptional regulator, IclR family [Lentzea flaviverrucosa]
MITKQPTAFPPPATVMTVQSPRDSRTSTRTAATKVLSVLQAFGLCEGAASLTELTRHADLPKSTVHRMVGFLRSEGLVEMIDNRFLLTAKITELSGAVPLGISDRTRELLLPVLADLYETTREAVQFSIRCGTKARIVERLHGRQSSELATRLRGPLPLHCTAPGKILLAGDPGLFSVLCAQGLKALTPASITTAEGLQSALTGIRKYGIAFDRSEWLPGFTGVAAPVWGPGPALIGTISAIGPVHRLTPDAIARRVHQAAETATRELHSTPSGHQVAG